MLMAFEIFSIKRLTIRGFILQIVLMIMPGHAAEYSLENVLKVTATHNDNIELLSTGGRSIQGQTIESKIIGKVAGAAWDSSLNLDLSLNTFNLSEYDSDDQIVTWSMNKKTELQTFGLNLNAIRDSTRTSEQDTSGLVTNSAVIREVYSVAPKWTYSVSDRSYISVNAKISETKYGSDRFTNFNYDSINVNFTRDLDDKTRIAVKLSGSDYRSEEQASLYLGTFELGIKTESASYGVQVGAESSLTEAWSLSGFIGSTYTEKIYQLRDPDNACNAPALESLNLKPSICSNENFRSSNFTADLSTSWSGERSGLQLSYSIQNQPSSQGYEVESELVRVDWNYNMTEKGLFKSRLKYGTNRTAGSSGVDIGSINNNRDFASADINYIYRVTKHLNFDIKYMYRWQDRKSLLGDADSNAVSIGINYQPIKSNW